MLTSQNSTCDWQILLHLWHCNWVLRSNSAVKKLMLHSHCSNRTLGNILGATRDSLFELLSWRGLGDHAANSVWSTSWRGKKVTTNASEPSLAAETERFRPLKTLQKLKQQEMDRVFLPQTWNHHHQDLHANYLRIRTGYKEKYWTIGRTGNQGGGYSQTFGLWHAFGGHWNTSDEIFWGNTT